MFYDLKPIQQMQKLQEILRPQDKEVLKDWANSRFWELIKALLEEKITKSKDFVYNAGVRKEEYSKLKWNDRDIELAKIEVLNDIIKSPEFISILIDNTEFKSDKKVQS